MADYDAQLIKRALIEGIKERKGDLTTLVLRFGVNTGLPKLIRHG
jgi:hypothetical protein